MLPQANNHSHVTGPWCQTAAVHAQDRGPDYAGAMTPDRLAVGPFTLLTPVGSGGMGEVWRGVHEEQGIYVAIKVLTRDRDRDPRHVAAFQNEIRAMAALDHPAIVRIHDYGLVPAGPGPTTELLRAGRPYLVMELIEGGSLSRAREGLSWPRLRAILLTVLDALAHAHARGMVHRDLKPENVLLDLGGDTLKVSDFGLAHALDWSPSEMTGQTLIQGTPAYMAPEQFIASWRDYGPWTDLYALGCMGWALATGVPPFGRQGDLRTLRRSHARQPPPPFHPRYPVPEDLEPWLRRLLAKRAHHRFRRAADARLALEGLGEPISVAPAGPVCGSQPLITQETIADEEDLSETRTLVETGALEWITVAGDEESLRTPIRVPDLPEEWRPARSEGRGTVLDGVGLGLIGLRELPVLGREAEQDILWRLLREVHTTHTPRVAVLHGPAGCGRTHLARWFCQRAEEVGGAITLRVVHQEHGGRHQGLIGMVSHHLGTRGLPRLAAFERVEDHLAAAGQHDESECHALTELVCPATDQDLPGLARRVRFQSARERHILVERLLARICKERPLILWLGDVHWGAESLSFVQGLVAAPEARPILVLATAQDDALAHRPAEAELLWDLSTRTAATSLEIGPLDRARHAALVRRVLGLEGDLARRVEDRTAGNPLFAIQLVGDWVQRGVLEPSPTGFRLASGSEPRLPDDLHAVWTARLSELLTDRPTAHGRALELAATLGMEIHDDEWGEACGRAGLELPADLVEDLCVQRLATRDRDGPRWAFVHGMLRECLLRRAREGGRWRSHNRACADVLRSGSEQPERLGRHLLAAGDFEGALGPLLDGVRERLASGDARGAGRLLRLWDEAMEQVDLPPEDTRRGAGDLERCRHARLMKDLRAAEEAALRVQQAGERHGWQRLRAQALRERGRLARLRGEAERSQKLLLEAEARAGKSGDRRLQADCRWELGHLLVDSGQLDDAGRFFHEANVDYQTLQDETGRGHCETGLGVIDRQRQAIAESRRRLERAARLYTRSGSRWGVAETHIHRGDVDRLAGDLDLARANYEEARQRYGALGVEDHALLDQREGLLQLEQDSLRAARPLLTSCLETFRSQQRTLLEASTHVFLLPCVVEAEDWLAWDLHLSRARALLGDSGTIDIDVARMSRLAGHLARRKGRLERAKEAYGLALAQFRGLGDRREVLAMRASLKALR